MSSASDKSVNLRRKRNFCSTPLKEKTCSLSSIPISGFETNSSASLKNARATKSQPIENRKKTSRKKLPKKSRVYRKRKRVASSSDSDWTTRSEESVHETSPRESPVEDPGTDKEPSRLFQEAASPERARDATFVVHGILESPVFRPRRRFFLEEDVERVEQLELKDLQSVAPRSLHEEDEEELFLRQEDVKKTYPAPKRAKKCFECTENQGKWLVSQSLPTAYANLLWEKFVKENLKNTGENYAPRRFQKKKSSHRENNSEDITEKTTAKNFKKSSTSHIDLPKPPPKIRRKKKVKEAETVEMNFVVTSGYWDEFSKKWIHKEDQYKFPEDSDVEFRNENKISFAEFRKAEKQRKNQNLSNSEKKKSFERKRNLPSDESSSSNFEASAAETTDRVCIFDGTETSWLDCSSGILKNLDKFELRNGRAPCKRFKMDLRTKRTENVVIEGHARGSKRKSENVISAAEKREGQKEKRESLGKPRIIAQETVKDSRFVKKDGHWQVLV